MNKITVISYNLWDDQTLKTERTKWISKNIIKERPDVILFQEVSNANVLKLTEKLRKQNYNYRASTQGRTSFELVASKWPILDYKFSRYSTGRTGLGLLWAELDLKDLAMTIATSKLEPDPHKTARRIGQLECALEYLDSRDGIVIFGCDTGFQHDEDYYDYPEDWEDAWDAAGRNKFARYTLDSARNKFLTGNVQQRSDRIYYRGDLDDLSLDLIGTTSEAASTHFGLRFTFVIESK